MSDLFSPPGQTRLPAPLRARRHWLSALVFANVVGLVLLAACTQGGAPPARPAETTLPVRVLAHGSFQAALHEGKTAAAISLAPLRADKSLVGLGVLSSLRGEVTLFDGQAFLAIPNQDGTFRTEELGSHQDSAAFLVVASVPAWQSVSLPQNTAFDDLASAIEELAEGAGVDVEQPFPLMIEGAFGSVTLSVVDGSAFAGERQVSAEALKTASAKAMRAAAQGTIVGFFGKGEHPEFLAPGSALHLHFVERLGTAAGHVERVDLPSGTSFRLPLARR